MNFKDDILVEDIKNFDEFIKEYKLEKKTFLITGATGLVGSLLVRYLLMSEQEPKVIAIVRNIEKAKNLFSNYDHNRLQIIVADLNDKDFLNTLYHETDSIHVDYIFHCAAVTASRVMVSKPVETITTAIVGTNNILQFAAKSNCDSIVYVSSMEVYGSVPEGELATEDNLGKINILALRSNYPESKRMCENLCVAYNNEFGLRIKIARLAQTFGAGILPWENRVFAQFAKSVIENKDIILHTKGLSEGNYCYSLDAIKGLITILFKGESGEAYNVVNEKTHMTICDMANLVASEVANNRIKVVFDIPVDNKYGYASDTKLTLSGEKLAKLGWYPKYDLKDAYIRTIESMEMQRAL